MVPLKQYCDKKDNLLIYKVSDRRRNPDRLSFVFKISEEKMKLRQLKIMDRNGELFLRDEYCFFDKKFKRCRNFVTLTASVYISSAAENTSCCYGS